MAFTHKDGSIVMGMIARGDAHHDIAAWFSDNQGRIAEIANGKMFGSIPAAAPSNELPPKGPVGIKGMKLRAYALCALEALKKKGADGVSDAVKELEEGLNYWESNQ